MVNKVWRRNLNWREAANVPKRQQQENQHLVDEIKVEEMESHTVWILKKTSDLLMIMTPESFPQFPGFSFYPKLSSGV